jgi:spermidine synthase
VAHTELGLRPDTPIKTYNQDARLFLIQRKSGEKYDIIVADVFNDYSTPYHLTTLEFNRLVKTNLKKEGVYLININDFKFSRYTPSFIHTLRKVFDYVYLFNTGENWEEESDGTPIITSTGRIIAATDHFIDLSDYMMYVTENGQKVNVGYPLNEFELKKYLAQRSPILLTDDHAPTDILLAPIFH